MSFYCQYFIKHSFENFSNATLLPTNMPERKTTFKEVFFYKLLSTHLNIDIESCIVIPPPSSSGDSV